MAGRKFGSTGVEWLTWAINVMVPHNVAHLINVAEVDPVEAVATLTDGLGADVVVE